MIRDITIGQYYPADSVIHRLDARTKVIGTLTYVIAMLCIHSIWGYLAATLFFAFVLALSRVPFRFVVRGLKPVFMLMIFTALLNLFWTPGHIIWRWGIFSVSWEGVYRSFSMVLRLILMIIGSSVMTLTTTPNQLTDALEHLMGPLNRLHVPVHEIAMMMGIALRFIPILLEETDKIMKAQMSRGADFESGNTMKRLRSMAPLLVPLFVSAARRANELAYAMDARCYHGGAGRTRMKPLTYQARDGKAFGILAGYVAVLVVMGRLGVL